MRDEDSVFCHYSMSSHTMIVLAQTTGNAACVCLYLQIGALHTLCLQALTYLVSMLLLRHHWARSSNLLNWCEKLGRQYRILINPNATMCPHSVFLLNAECILRLGNLQRLIDSLWSSSCFHFQEAGFIVLTALCSTPATTRASLNMNTFSIKAWKE